MKISANISLTASKLLAFLIFIFGTAYAFTFKDGNALTTSATIAGGVIAVKTGSTAYVSGKEATYGPSTPKVSSTGE